MIRGYNYKKSAYAVMLVFEKRLEEKWCTNPLLEFDSLLSSSLTHSSSLAKKILTTKYRTRIPIVTQNGIAVTNTVTYMYHFLYQ